MNSENKDIKKNVDEISLKEFVLKLKEWRAYLLKKWIWVFCFGVFGGLIGLLYGTFKKTIYTATTTFVLEDGDQSSGMGQYAGIASMVGLNLGGGGGGIFQGDNILELYKSRTMIEKTLLSEVIYNKKKQLLIDRYIDFNGLRNKWVRQGFGNIKFNNTPQSFSRLQDSLIGVFVNNINDNYLSVTKPDKKLSIIKAVVKSSDEFFAKSFNEQIVKNVNDFYVQTKTKKSLENIAILQQKTDSVRMVMNGAIYNAALITDATPNLNPTRQVQRVAPVQRSQFNAETNKSILSELVKNLEMSKISLRKETPLIQIIDSPVTPLEKKSVSKIFSAIIGFVISAFLGILFFVTKRVLINLENI